VKRIIVFFIILLIATWSCKKDREFVPERAQTVQDFIGKYLICDSVISTFPGIVRKEVFGEGKGLDAVFRSDGMVEVYFASGFVNKAAYLLKNDTLYGWRAHASNSAYPSALELFKLVIPAKDRLVISDDRFPEVKKKFFYRIKTSGDQMPKPMTGNFNNFIGKTLYCDSMVITEGNFSRQIWLYGAGKGEDMVFHTTGFVAPPGQPAASGKRYEFKGPDTLYQWHPSVPRFPNDYIIVKTPSATKLNTIERIGARTKENFYTLAP
jgi:hypothetical protein